MKSIKVRGGCLNKHSSSIVRMVYGGGVHCITLFQRAFPGHHRMDSKHLLGQLSKQGEKVLNKMCQFMCVKGRKRQSSA